MDAHAYFGRRLRDDMLCPARDAAALVEVLNDASIDVAAIAAPDWVDVQGNETPPYAASTRAVFEAAEAFSDRLVPIVRVNPNWRDQSIAAFTDWARHPLCRGIRLHPQWDYFPVNSRLLLDPLMAICEERNVPIAFCSGTYPAAQPLIFTDLANRWPNVRIGLVHAGQRQMHDAIIVAERCPNISMITSPRVLPSTIQTLVRVLGPERVMFGSELPFEDPRYGIETVRSLPGLSDSDKGLVLGGNAARWLGLPAAATV